MQDQVQPKQQVNIKRDIKNFLKDKLLLLLAKKK